MGAAESVEAALVDLLDGVTGYSSASVKRNDWSVLNAGVNKAMVVGPGSIEFGSESTTFTEENDTFDLPVYLLIAYKTDAQADSDLAAETDAIVTKLRQYPRLNGASGVLWAEPVRADTPAGLFDEAGNGPHWWMREITVRVQFRSTTARLE